MSLSGVPAHGSATAPESPTSEAPTSDAQRRILNRLKRARGQLTAVIDAVESGSDCRAVVTQLSAVSSALDKAGFAIIATAMRDCLDRDRDLLDEERPTAASDARGEHLTVDELEKLFLTLS
ncbi:metal-sensitive transcriptional regulator [Agromyces sp. Leaf222]|uniref:metal-sensitive transcriptional regulator n=1 Tax=Agromyces sp. Leaf222 TaxID=1735688 RepID=UPI0009E6835D|nr:metal-sensitive transcriptional regulator [Agromyces sp. Leaf222]